MGWLETSETDLPFDKPINYYQLCAFKGIDGKHLVRKFVFKSPGKFLAMHDYKIKPSTYEVFKKQVPLRRYKEWSQYDFEGIPYPSNGECVMAKVDTPRILTQGSRMRPHIDYSSFKVFKTDY